VFDAQETISAYLLKQATEDGVMVEALKRPCALNQRSF
jgi:hypothetical protein